MCAGYSKDMVSLIRQWAAKLKTEPTPEPQPEPDPAPTPVPARIPVGAGA